MFNQETKQPVIIDIGGSTDKREGAVTFNYCSPEQIKEHHRRDPDPHVEITNKSDVYALGCTLGYLLTGKNPFDYIAANALEAERGSNLERPPFREEDLYPLDSDVVELIMAMTHHDPEQRPSLEQIMQAASAADMRAHKHGGELDGRLRALNMREQDILTAQDQLADLFTEGS
jgi:serine/threonine protein kinase